MASNTPSTQFSMGFMSFMILSNTFNKALEDINLTTNPEAKKLVDSMATKVLIVATRI